MIRDWHARFLETLSIFPKSHAENQTERKISEERKAELVVRNLLNNELSNRWIGRAGPISWAPRSPNLSINDFWLWSYLRCKVYQEPKARTLDELVLRVNRVFQEIEHEMVSNCFQNFIKSCEKCIAQNGGHLNNICKNCFNFNNVVF